jgi:hypothetical protein
VVSPWDKEYVETKRIKLGLVSLADREKAAAEWISERYGVDVLNVILDQLPHLMRPRVQVILDRESDEPKFKDGFNFSATIQEEICVHLKALGYPDADGRILVVFSSLERVARWEMNERVTSDQETALLDSIADPALWTIHRCTSGTTFFFHTEAQKSDAIRLGLQRRYSDIYFDLLVTYDEFGYLDRGNFQVNFDSRENFKEAYSESWFNYDR